VNSDEEQVRVRLFWVCSIDRRDRTQSSTQPRLEDSEICRGRLEQLHIGRTLVTDVSPNRGTGTSTGDVAPLSGLLLFAVDNGLKKKPQPINRRGVGSSHPAQDRISRECTDQRRDRIVAITRRRNVYRYVIHRRTIDGFDVRRTPRPDGVRLTPGEVADHLIGQTVPMGDNNEDGPANNSLDADVGDERVERRIRFVAADPQAIFDLLADPSKHPLIDGSGTVRGCNDDLPDRLELGSKFSMSMKMGVPYKMTNEVVEFEEPAQIAWCHLGGHIWRYRLRSVEGGTEVTEEFDWRPSRAKTLLRITATPKRNAKSLDATLDRLATHFAAG
jgi:hypothetical protein